MHIRFINNNSHIDTAQPFLVLLLFRAREQEVHRCLLDLLGSGDEADEIGLVMCVIKDQTW